MPTFLKVNCYQFSCDKIKRIFEERVSLTGLIKNDIMYSREIVRSLSEILFTQTKVLRLTMKLAVSLQIETDESFPQSIRKNFHVSSVHV